MSNELGPRISAVGLYSHEIKEGSLRHGTEQSRATRVACATRYGEIATADAGLRCRWQLRFWVLRTDLTQFEHVKRCGSC